MKSIFIHALTFSRNILKILKNPWVTRVYLLCLVLGIFYGLFRFRNELEIFKEITRLNILPLCVLSATASFLYYSFLHHTTYREMNVRIRYKQTFFVISMSQLGTYIPGKMWFMANYYLFSRKFNIDTERIGKNFVINNAMLFFTGAICSLLAFAALPFLAQEFLIVLPFLMLFLMHPKILNKIFAALISAFQAQPPDGEIMRERNDGISLSYTEYIRLTGLYFGLWILNTLSLYTCILTFSDLAVVKIHIVLAAHATSLILGLLAVFAPGGVGVTEGVGTVILSHIIDWRIAFASFVLLRVMRIIVHLFSGMISYALNIHYSRGNIGTSS